MKINKTLILPLIVLILSVIVLMIFVNNQTKKETDIYNYTAERIMYLITPLGRSEYNNLGMVDLNGVKVNLVTLRTLEI